MKLVCHPHVQRSRFLTLATYILFTGSYLYSTSGTGGEVGGSAKHNEDTELLRGACLIYAEERWWGNSVSLDYQVCTDISLDRLQRYAEKRVQKLCGGDYRYLSNLAETDDDLQANNVDIVAECFQ